MDIKNVISALSALAQDTRLAIFRLLIEVGQKGMMVGAIAEKLNIPHATLSFHLDKLHNADLIISRREGRATIYSANFDAFVGTIQYLTENCCKDSEQVQASSLKNLRLIEKKIFDFQNMRKTLSEITSECSGGNVPECPILDTLFDENKLELFTS